MRILQRGDTGNDVKQVQTALIRAGYDPGAVDGIFGVKTENAVKRFQRVLGLKVDGIVGPNTWAYLEPFYLETDPYVLRRGSKGDKVLALQKALDEAGNDPGDLDGLFCTKTLAAVKAFQLKSGLTDTGVVDDSTWLALLPYLDTDGVLLRRGDSGVYVYVLQLALKSLGYDPGNTGGVFDVKTESAVKLFQSDNDLRVDGIVGPKTWAVLKNGMPVEVILYTVKRGDTLSSIAKKYNTTVAELLELNPRRDPNRIYVGEVLKIPVTGS